MTVNPADPGAPGERAQLGFGRIRRGPMAADQFTQIRNAVFRDARLSAKAMGIFGNISTHRDGWGINPESLSKQMRDGVDSIKAGLRELEQYGYLRRTQTKKPDGTFGAAVYFITDEPELFDDEGAGELPSSPPSGDFPPTDSPPAVPPSTDQPPAGNPLHKNTNSKKTSRKKTLSPRVPQQPQEPPAPVEREIDPLTRKLMDEHGGTQDETEAVLAQVRAEGRIKSLVSWAASATGALDFKQRLADLRRPAHGAPAAGLALPPWCEKCNEGDEAARFNVRFRILHGEPCPNCHPDTIKDAA